jgi:cytidyltransferase-like protein
MSGQAKALGDVLVVGLIPDSEILAVKGPPVMNEQERMIMVSSLKWVDEVLTGANVVRLSNRVWFVVFVAPTTSIVFPFPL